MINYLGNYLPWRRFPLLGTWQVDVAATEESLRRHSRNKPVIESRLQSIAGDRWVFTRSYSRRKSRDSRTVDPAKASKRRYWWKLDQDERLFIIEAVGDGELIFKVDLIADDRFEFFEPGRGYAIVWKRV